MRHSDKVSAGGLASVMTDTGFVPSPRDSDALFHAHPPLKRWAFSSRLAGAGLARSDFKHLIRGDCSKNNPLLEDFEMFRVCHCRVTSLASGMLRMILPGSPTSAGEACPERSRRALAGVVRRPHCMRPSRPVSAQTSQVLGGRINTFMDVAGKPDSPVHQPEALG
jgi:hypothetical protein